MLRAYGTGLELRDVGLDFGERGCGAGLANRVWLSGFGFMG